VWEGVCDPLGGASIETNQLVLTGAANTDMQFPANLITGDEAVTVEAWASFGNTTVNNFFYGLGDSDTAGTGRWYLFASTHSSIRIAASDWDNGNPGEAQTVAEGQVADGLVNAHWVAVYDPLQGYEKIYLNGVPYEQCTNVIMPFSQSEVDNFNYLGKSLYSADPYFTGSISEFRIFNGAMSSNQVALDYAAGPYNTNILNGVTGGLVSSVLLGSNNVPQSVVWQTAFIGNFANITNVNLFFYSPCTTGSDDPTVCTITPGGVVTAVGAGTTQIHATNAASGAVASATVSVINLIPTLQHRYSFTAGSYADSVGGPAYTAIPNGTAQIVNNQLVLDGVAASVTLPGTNEPTSPAGILSNYVAYSFEAWVSIASNNPAGTWLYMFGDANPINGLARYYTGLEANGANNVVASITQGDPGTTGAQNATYTVSSLDGPTNTYVAVVEHPYGGFEELFINGRLSAINTNITTFFSSVQDNFSYLGISTGTNSPFLAGTIDEFRIWSGVLPRTQIIVDNAAGPNTVPASTNLGTFTNAVLVVNSNMVLNSVQIASLPAVYQFYSNVDLFSAATPPPLLAAGNTNVLTISAIPGVAGSATNIITAIGPGTSTVTTHFGTNTYTATITVALPAPPQLMHEYSFFDATNSTTVTDSIGNLTGTLPNGATLSGAGLISFIGTNSQYLNLPGGVLSNYSQVSIDMWVASESAAATSPPYTYLWMIGNQDGANGDDYIFFNPNLGRITISGTDPGFNAEQGGTFGTLDAYNTTGVHITGVYNVPGSIQVYTNGVLLVSYTGITDPLSVVGTQFAYFGQSTYTADTYENFALNELRIYSGALDAATVAAIQSAGPHNAVAVPRYSLSIAHVTNSVYSITYPWAAVANGQSLLSSTNIGSPGHFTAVAGLTPLNIGGGNYQVQVTASNTATYYSLGK
jgi:Concanavalin A-like lectin/glucanases superfamily